MKQTQKKRIRNTIGDNKDVNNFKEIKPQKPSFKEKPYLKFAYN